MIDIEILTAVLKELGYLDEFDEEKEESAKHEPTSKPEQKEHDDDDKEV